MKRVQHSFKVMKKWAKEFSKTGNYPEIKIIDKTLSISDELKEVIKETAWAMDFLEKHKSEKFIVERLRPNTVGDIINDKSGEPTIALNRGKPEGFIAAISDSKNIYFGVSYSNPSEKYVLPVIGQAIALQRAIENKDKKYPEKISKIFLKKHHKKQIEHFFNRSKAYFFPEIFSFSRGSNPLNYYDEKLHNRQEYAKLLKSKYFC